MRIAVVLVLALCACKDKPAAAPVAGSAAVAAPVGGLSKLAVAIDGAPVAMQRAFVKRVEPDRYQVYLTNRGGSCKELLDNLFLDRDKYLLFDATPRLNQDGKQSLEISELYFGRPTMVIAPGATIAIRGDASADAAVDVELDFAAEATDRSVKVSARGGFGAIGCGAREPAKDGLPRVAHPTSATLQLANQRLELKGAIVKGTDIVLSTTPKDCGPFTPWSTVILAFERGAWKLSGTWIAKPVEQTSLPDEATKQLAIARGAAGTSEDGPTIALTLSGSGTLGGYPLALAGTIEALDCK